MPPVILNETFPREYSRTGKAACNTSVTLPAVPISTLYSPGLANILAREAYEDLEEVDELSIMTLEDQKGSTFVIPWSREEMLNVASIDLAYKNKQFFFPAC